MVDPTTPPSPPPDDEPNWPPWWSPIAFLLFAAFLALLNKYLTGYWCKDGPECQQPQRRAPQPAPLTRVVVQPRRNAGVLNSFIYKGDYDQCGICLSVFEEDGEVKQIPKCKHCFHARCIDTWLNEHADCPLCRSVVAPTVVLPQK